MCADINCLAGDEAWVLQTAPVAPLKEDVFPLVPPPATGQVVLDNSTAAAAASPFIPARNWGNLSPWWSVGGAFGLPNASAVVPDGCELTQVHLLHRHGARYPTSGSSPAAFAAKIHEVASSTGFNASGPLEFLNTWTYKLGAELLTPFGREQLWVSFGSLDEMGQSLMRIRCTVSTSVLLSG